MKRVFCDSKMNGIYFVRYLSKLTFSNNNQNVVEEEREPVSSLEVDKELAAVGRQVTTMQEMLVIRSRLRMAGKLL